MKELDIPVKENCFNLIFTREGKEPLLTVQNIPYSGDIKIGISYAVKNEDFSGGAMVTLSFEEGPKNYVFPVHEDCTIKQLVFLINDFLKL
jgi:hypothetical protein